MAPAGMRIRYHVRDGRDAQLRAPAVPYSLIRPERQPLRFQFSDVALADQGTELRAAVRAFLDDERAGGRFASRPNSWMHYDAQFTRRCGERGFIGMTFPQAYGGRDASALERYIVCEEMLAAGAPVGMHWIADRQSGPQILRHGSQAAKSAID